MTDSAQRKKHTNFLLYRKLPQYFTGIDRLGVPVFKRLSKDEELKAVEEINANVEIWQNLSDEDLKALYEAEKIAYEEEKLRKEEMERLQREKEIEEFLKEHQADFAHWAKVAYWDKTEIAALICNIDPGILRHKDIPNSIKIFLVEKLKKFMSLLERAIESYQLDHPIKPDKFMLWATRFEVDVPKELKEKVFKYYGMPQSNKSNREIETLKKQVADLENQRWTGLPVQN